MPPPKSKRPVILPGSAQPRASRRRLLDILPLPAALLTLAAFTSPISQATLAPVFGSIPSSINHSQAIAATPLLGFLWRWQFKQVSREIVLGCLAAWVFWLPVVSAFLFRYSANLGIVYGPALIGFMSCHAIIIPAAYAAAEALEELDVEGWLGPVTTPLLLALMGDFHVVSFEKFFRVLLPGLNTLTSVCTPVKMQAFIASTLAYLSHCRLALLGIPALIHVFSANPHFDSARTLSTLNTTLNQQNWSIVARQWSNTGYISVLDNLESDFRVMRADHSLLGGEWIANERRRKEEGWLVNEPIYAVFEMLEAVRLVPTSPPILDSEAQALVIGLGIGTAPKALLSHGINTTVIELDPAVHEYAVDYFGLPTNHTSIIQDAVSAVHTLRTDDARPPYDYIIHDVFTGGAEPLALFTVDFLTDLHAVLADHGVVAINYAGDTDSPLTRKVLRTIRATFGDSCRAFRDAPPPPPSSAEATSAAEALVAGFANMVIFCRRAGHREPVTFRPPVRADLLGRKSAERYLLPAAANEVALPDVNGPTARATVKGLLLHSELGDWTERQTQSAMRHWQIMRTVLPDVVWELW